MSIAWCCTLAEELPGNPAPGARGTILTSVEGGAPQELPVSYLGTYPDFTGPGHDLHLIRLEGPVAERVGAANGMSGSPVYIEGRLIGALAYRLGQMPKIPVAGVTPIEDVLAAGEVGALPTSNDDSGISPIATPIFVGGLAGPVRDWLVPQLELLGLTTVAGGGRSERTGPPLQLAPGTPVGVQLVRGDMSIAATGTVTLVDGDRVYAFGHPFLGSGNVELPMVTAEVIHTLSDYTGGVSLATIGSAVGTIVEDRQAGIVGTLGRQAPMMPVELAIAGGDYGDRKLSFEIARSPALAPILGATVVANALLSSNGYSRESTMMLHGTVRLNGLPDIPLEMAVAGTTGGPDPSIGLAARLYAVLNYLWNNPFQVVEVEGIDLSIDARKEIVSYRVENVFYDRGALRPGQALRVRCVLRAFRGETITREFELSLPDQLPRTGSLVLAVGSPLAIEQALGGTLEQRMLSARDLVGVVRALADVRSEHRLTAVVYERGGAVVSRGIAFTELPPTAEHLLSLQRTSTAGKPVRRVSPLVRDEQPLDGPVGGGKQLRLRVKRGFDTGEEG